MKEMLDYFYVLHAAAKTNFLIQFHPKQKNMFLKGNIIFWNGRGLSEKEIKSYK